MCNFNNHDDEAKAYIHLFMTKASQSVGGVNILLSLIESLKEKKPNALILSEKKVKSKEAQIEWNKIVFKDKFDTLEDVIRSHKSSEGYNFNILDTDNSKTAKKILNMIKTLAPIEFVVKANSGDGFTFKVFDKVEDGYASINPIFVAIFFCSTEFTKKALKYEI
ncbi:hypothetical protein [Sulfurimonas sp.]|uniref:hypothetical protein n=1 Tax=Sulfurimonas sp. TaxID=2022749 RepID=UPI003561DDC1